MPCSAPTLGSMHYISLQLSQSSMVLDVTITLLDNGLHLPKTQKLLVPLLYHLQ
jgi:hypothetical protein